MEGAYRDGRTWMIPAGAAKPERKPRAGKLPDTLIKRLREEQESGLSGGIYRRLQIDFSICQARKLSTFKAAEELRFNNV